MKLVSLVTLAFATVTYAGKCSIVNYPGVVNAIDRFCAKQDMTVPSNYAAAGKNSGFPWPAAHVQINGNCGPAQWVPQKYCITQFQNMCGNQKTQQRFGRNGCQIWNITYDKKKKICNPGEVPIGCDPDYEPAK
ncbi:hypothetical protein DOTSEDRAFT_33622 [Dothistroma septosporum NZE10]|uniref:Secreted protein n=1 Tax=Dothistroma septosporum (strain NZE10 / CBS 128990) TaxID=675120 RepID=N1PRM0_DOTSN|nr:hypothetical protein DOTSEDRAFT_33622 [Dothistroma septosporum NZE10]